jgi:DNA gyrase subunit A
VINVKANETTGKVIAIKEVFPEDELILITRNGIINRQRISEIRVIGRATQGVRLMSLDEGDIVVDVARLVPEDENGEEGGPSADGGPPRAEGEGGAEAAGAESPEALVEEFLEASLAGEEFAEEEMLAEEFSDEELTGDEEEGPEGAA